MKNNYQIWRTEHFDGSHQEYFKVADWGEKAKTKFTFPVCDLKTKSYDEALKKAKELGYEV